MIKLCSFDVWNTLLNLNLMLKLFGKSLSELTGKSFENISEEIMRVRRDIKRLRGECKISAENILDYSQKLLAEKLQIDSELVKRATAKAVLKMDKNIVFEETLNMLRKLREKNLRIIIIGNVMFWPSPYTRLILERFHVADYIDKQFYSDELKAYKPMKEIFLKPLKYFSIKPIEAIHVGDTREEDYIGALNAGLYAAWINPHGRFKKANEKGYVIASLENVPEILKEINKMSSYPQ